MLLNLAQAPFNKIFILISSDINVYKTETEKIILYHISQNKQERLNTYNNIQEIYILKNIYLTKKL
jgi:hypothetical protein